LPAQTSGYTLHETLVLLGQEVGDILEQMDQLTMNSCRFMQQAMTTQSTSLLFTQQVRATQILVVATCEGKLHHCLVLSQPSDGDDKI